MKVVNIILLALVGALAVYNIVHHEADKTDVVPPTTGSKTFSESVKDHLWDKYRKQYNIFGAASEQRYRIFSSNLDLIEEHNAKESSYKLGITPFTHLTREEFTALHLGYKKVHHNKVKTASSLKIKSIQSLLVSNSTPVVVPGAVDWATAGAVTPVKNQGQCGSCWSFSTTGALEGLNYIANHKLVSFSEQELIDCSTSYGNNGCSGGLMDHAFAYVRDCGITTEEASPYLGTDGNQCNNATTPRAFKINGFSDVTPNDVHALTDAIKKQPVSVAIEADTQAFQLYKSGVLTGDACGVTLDHGVLAVGFGSLDGVGFIKVKNSWGPEWGLNGFILIGQASGAGICGINSNPSYPTL